MKVKLAELGAMLLILAVIVAVGGYIAVLLTEVLATPAR